MSSIKVRGGLPPVSKPPSGKHKIANMYWDNDLQKVVVEKSTEPEP